MKLTKSKIILLCITSLLISGLAGCASTEKPDKTAEKPVKEAAASEAVPVKTAIVSAMPISDTITLSGILAAKNEVVVSSKIGGELKVLNKEVGSKVKKGELLATLDSTQYALQKKKALLGLENAKATLKNTQNQLARTLALAESGSVTPVEVEQAKLQTQVAEIAVQNAQLDIDSIVLNLSYCRVSAPITGVITDKRGAVGENIGAGQMLYHLVDITNLVVDTGVSESQVSRLEVGAPVKLSFLGDATVTGKIESVSPVMDQASKTYPVRIAVSNADQKLKVGMTVSTEIVLGDKRDVLAVEKASVIITNDTYSVMKVTDGKAVKTQVTIGASSATHYEILSGLSAGDQIVTSNPGLLKGNESITIVK